jgi:hypothetical protein
MDIISHIQRLEKTFGIIDKKYMHTAVTYHKILTNRESILC